MKKLKYIRITENQRDVFKLWCEGFYPKEISKKMGFSLQYASKTIKLVRAKLGLDTRHLAYYRDMARKQRADFIAFEEFRQHKNPKKFYERYNELINQLN